MGSIQQRSGLQAWTQLLADKPLPVKSQTIQRLKTVLADPNNSLQQLATIIATDPVFTLHLIHKANDLNQNSNNEANSADLGVSTLGMDHLVKLIDEVPIIKMKPNSVPHRWYYRSLDASLHASIQAADFCLFPNANVVADTKLAAMFYAVGHWALWRYAPIEMSGIKDAVFRQKKTPSQAEQSILGCTIQEISAFLVNHWHLSTLANEALQQPLLPDEKTLKHLQAFTAEPNSLSDDQQKTMRHLMSSKHYPVTLANWFVQEVEIDWNSEQSQRIQQCIADLLKTDVDQSRRCILQNAISVSQLAQTEGLLTPAAQLLMLPSDFHIPYEMNQTKAETTKTTSTVQKKTADKTANKNDYLLEDDFKNKELFQQVCRKLLLQEGGCDSVKEVYKALVHGLKEALGYQRTCLLKVDEYSTVSVAALSGFNGQEPMRRFTQKLAVPGLLNKITKKTSAIMMNDQNRLQLKQQMSDRFKVCTHQTSFALMSVHHNDQPTLLIYVDHGDSPIEISPFFFKYYKAICNAASQRLSQLAESSR